jgi:hypothetical protein
VGAPTAEAVAQAVFAVAAPKRVKVGSVLRVTGVPATWAVAYQWQRNGRAVGGATASSHRITRADVGAKLAAVVTVAELGLAKATARYPVKVTPTLTAKRVGGQVAVKVSVPGPAKAAGKVTVKLTKAGRTVKWSGKSARVLRLKTGAKGAAVRRGQVAVALPRLAEGRYKLTVSYSGSSTAAPRSLTRTVAVGR